MARMKKTRMRDEEDVETKLVSMSVSKSLIRDWRDSITAFLSSSANLSREHCRLG